MKRLINIALAYLIAGAVSGVFFREFTKFAGFEGTTTLGLMHSHLLVLGFLVFLNVTLFALFDDFTKDKLFAIFLCVYNAGLTITAAIMFVRGIIQVTNAPLVLPDAALSGLAGIGHILTGVGLVLLVVIVKRLIERRAASTNKVSA